MGVQTQTEERERKADFTTIYVSKEVRKALAMIKVANDLKTYDEVLRFLLQRAGYGNQ